METIRIASLYQPIHGIFFGHLGAGPSMADIEKLRRLKELYEDGLLTRSEYDERRLRIIDGDILALDARPSSSRQTKTSRNPSATSSSSSSPPASSSPPRATSSSPRQTSSEAIRRARCDVLSLPPRLSRV